MFARVVVGIGADGGARELQLAQALAPDALLVLVHVCPELAVVGTLPVVSDHGEEEAAALELLAHVRRAVQQPCELVVERAPSVRVGLHRVARQEEADLLVVAAHEPSATRSGVAAIVRHAPCPVAVASEDQADGPVPLDAVAVAYRPTAAGRYAAQVARRLADERSAALHAVTVVPGAPNPWLGPAVGGLQTIAQLDGTREELARGDLRQVTAATPHVLGGEPVAELREFSQAVDLMVVGARVHHPVWQLMTGSTSAALAPSCPCALLIVGA